MFLDKLVTEIDPQWYKNWSIGVFWCEICDLNKVDFKKPETGKFFRFDGHVMDFRAKATGDFETCVTAVCDACLKENS